MTELEEAAALAALGLMSDDVPNHVRPSLVRAFREAAALIAESVAPVAPPPSLRARLLDRVADFETLKPIADVRPYDGAWMPAAPGVDTKILFIDKATKRTTMLVRMQPGAKLPAHRHH